MENKKNILLFPFAILLAACLLTACGKRGPHEALFREVETIVNERPDSALALLETIERPNSLPDKDWNRGALLWTQAKDKLHTSDTLINRVAAYYDKHGDNHQKALAYYYKGRVNNDLGKLEEATTAYLTASDYAEETDDVNLSYGILSQIGTLYARQDMTNEAFDVYKEALEIARQAGDSVKLAFSYAYLGRIYGEKDEWDKADSCYQHSIQISRLIHNYRTLRLGIQELSAVYTEQGRLSEALLLVRQLKDFEHINGLPENGGLDLVIGDIYRKSRQLDSAYYYLSQAMGSDNIYTRRSTYEALSHLFQEKNQYEEASRFDQLHHAAIDSIEAMGAHSDIRQIKDQFDWKEREAFWLNVYVGGSVVGLILATIILILSRRYLKERKGREAEEEKRKMIEEEKFRLEKRLSEAESQLKESEKLLTLKLESLSEYARKATQSEISLKASLEELRQAQEKAAEASATNDTIRTELRIAQEKVAQGKAQLKVYQEKLENAQKEVTEAKKAINQLEKRCQDLALKKKQIEENVDKWLLDSPNRTKLLLDKLSKSPHVITQDEQREIMLGTKVLYPYFLKRLKEKHSSLTEDDLLIACLIRWDFTNKEKLACVLSIQRNSIKKRFYRLREKFLPLRLETYKDLVQYIQDFPSEYEKN